MPTLLDRRVDLAALDRAEDARLDRLDLPTAARALVEAVEALAAHEAERLGIDRMDPTYHGCAPAWRDALYAAGDVRHVA